MKRTFAVELVGESREVYFVEAETEQEARDSWMDGILQIQESSGMDVVSVREEEA